MSIHVLRISVSLPRSYPWPELFALSTGTPRRRATRIGSGAIHGNRTQRSSRRGSMDVTIRRSRAVFILSGSVAGIGRSLSRDAKDHSRAKRRGDARAAQLMRYRRAAAYSSAGPARRMISVPRYRHRALVIVGGTSAPAASRPRSCNVESVVAIVPFVYLPLHIFSKLFFNESVRSYCLLKYNDVS